jgi:phosphinothricin acetyltransferase
MVCRPAGRYGHRLLLYFPLPRTPCLSVTVENSIYIDPAYQRQGVGKALLDHALKWAEFQGYRQMIAVVGDSANVAALHIRAGFTEIGTLKDIGFKHGRWLDTVLLQMKLGEGNSTLPEDSDLML